MKLQIQKLQTNFPNLKAAMQHKSICRGLMGWFYLQTKESMGTKGKKRGTIATPYIGCSSMLQKGGLIR